jgi:hypothetical protein
MNFIFRTIKSLAVISSLVVPKYLLNALHIRFSDFNPFPVFMVYGTLLKIIQKCSLWIDI